jgi:hypothetical protein
VLARVGARSPVDELTNPWRRRKEWLSSESFESLASSSKTSVVPKTSGDSLKEVAGKAPASTPNKFGS